VSRVGAFLNPGRALDASVDLARRADALGYESVWVTHGGGRDSFLVLSAYAAAGPRIHVGNGVVPIYPRHPTAMAQAALTLSEMTRGRFRLGIGVSHKPSMEGQLGLTLSEPLQTTREYVEVLRGAFSDGASFEGKHYRVKWTMAVPERPPAPPIYLATLGPKMCELAGEIADGAILWLCAPEYIRRVALPAFERGRKRAGKPLEGFDVVAAVPVALTDDPSGTGAAFCTELSRYLALPFYRAMMEGSGLGAAVKEFDRTGQTPQALADALGAVGDAATCRAYVDAYRAAGVTLPALRPIGFPESPWYRPTLEAGVGW
jgi:F420-dependent oxidoreductase-like protein